jgi:hypothetical protein
LNKKDIQDLYKETILRGKGLSPKGGAGLGLIVMAKTTSNDFTFNFEPIDDLWSYFILEVHLN